MKPLQKPTRARDIIEPETALARRTRRAFLLGGTATLAGLGGYEWLRTRAAEDKLPWPHRRVLSWNETLAKGYLSDSHLMPSYSREDVQKLRPNGSIGLDDDMDNEGWRIQVAVGDSKPIPVALSDLKALPKLEMITRFCCIEGWSSIAHWGGVRFSEFTRKFFPPGAQLPSYVYMATPDEEYFVSLDMQSALHPQTLLAYEQNGGPLAPEHGAPIRLVSTVKYGIKNIKRIGTIQYTNQRLPDYWAQEGYDWFAGL